MCLYSLGQILFTVSWIIYVYVNKQGRGKEIRAKRSCIQLKWLILDNEKTLRSPSVVTFLHIFIKGKSCARQKAVSLKKSYLYVNMLFAKVRFLWFLFSSFFFLKLLSRCVSQQFLFIHVSRLFVFRYLNFKSSSF